MLACKMVLDVPPRPAKETPKHPYFWAHLEKGHQALQEDEAGTAASLLPLEDNGMSY